MFTKSRFGISVILKLKIAEAWNELPQSFIDKPIDKFQPCLDAVMDENVGKSYISSSAFELSLVIAFCRINKNLQVHQKEEIARGDVV